MFNLYVNNLNWLHTSNRMFDNYEDQYNDLKSFTSKLDADIRLAGSHKLGVYDKTMVSRNYPLWGLEEPSDGFTRL